MYILLKALAGETLFIDFVIGLLGLIIVGLLAWLLTRVIHLTDVIATQNLSNLDRTHATDLAIIEMKKDIATLTNSLPDSNKVFAKMLALEYKQASLERAILRINRYLNRPESTAYLLEDESKE